MTKDEDKTKEQLMKELAEMHQQVKELEASKTERKRAEERLAESEEKYHNLVERANDGILVIQDRIVKYANPHLAKLGGYSIEEIIGTAFTDYVHPDEVPKLVEHYKRRIAGKDVESIYETVLKSKDGGDVDAEINAGIVSYQGKPAELVLVRDITQRKRVEKALREERDKAQEYLDVTSTTLSAIPHAVIGLHERHITFANNAVEDVFGWKPEELIGKTTRVLYRPDEEYGEIGRHFYPVLDSQKTHFEEFPCQRKDGSDIVCLVSASRMGENLREKRIVVTYTDITEHRQAEEKLRESEEKYRALFEDSRDAVYISTRDGKLTSINQAYLDLFSYTREEATGLDVRKTYANPDDRPRYQQEMEREGAVKDFELRLRKEDGAELDCLLTATVRQSQDGVTLGYQGIIRDITERRQMEAEKLELEQQAQMASRLATVGEMASGIAHEINNPLTAVIGYADLVLERDIPQEVKEDVRIIHNGAKRVADIIKRLLTFARQYQPERTYLDINDIIKTTLEFRAYELETSSIKVTTHLAPDLPRTMADAGQLQQVFLNLIINAETEMGLAHEGGKLLVKTETVGNTLRISFKDDGPGITKENLEKIFNPFFTTREVGKGTGLGLSLCHGIIAEHNGRIYAKSKPGKGATFIVELPVITEEKQLEMAGPAEEVKKVAPARILVVDDEPAICRFLKRVLTGEGHEVETSASAGDALEKMKGTRYNLILLDIKLPDMSGIELYKHIKDATPTWAKRIVFITGDVMGTDTRSFLSRSRVPYITKPFDIEQLKKEINRLLTEGA